MLLDIVKKGVTDRSIPLRIIDSTDGTPETGVVFNTSGIDLWYRREGAAKVSITEATLAALTTAHSDGGFLHISDGVYRLDSPDAAFATGANHVDFGGTVTGMIVIGGRVRLVDYDPEASLPNVTVAAVANGVNGIQRSGTAQSVGATSLVMDSGANFADNVLIGSTVELTSGTHIGAKGIVTANVGSTDTLTIGGGWSGGVTPTGTPTFQIFASAAGSGVAQTGDAYAVLTSILPDSIPADGTRPTPLQAIYMLIQYMLERSVAGTTVTVKKADGSTTLFTQQLNDASTPTSVTRLT